eukprot:13897064-Alexandrium_andersonii.AAC.1
MHLALRHITGLGRGVCVRYSACAVARLAFLLAHCDCLLACSLGCARARSLLHARLLACLTACLLACLRDCLLSWVRACLRA